MPEEQSGMKKKSFHVLIIGGGIGGLCLAQGLKKSGISVAVYERDASAHFRGQGYRISIKEDGSQALCDCLPENLFKLCVATAIKPATRMIFLDQQLNQKFAQPIAPLPADVFFGVNRLTLREILLVGLEGIVHFGKTFERLDQLDTGQVCAYFTDGTSAIGDLLVGADGTNSVVRAMVVPDAQIDALGSSIYGKTLITSNTLDWVPPMLIDSFNRMAAPDGVRMAVATCRKRESFMDATAKLAPSVYLTDMPDYLAWMVDRWSADRTFAGEQFQCADSATLYELACKLLAQWPPQVRRIVEEATVSTLFPVTLHSARPVERWQTTNITLLGDAIHTMSPGRGEGANTTLRDARLLRHALIDVVKKAVPLVQAKEQYEEEMLRYGLQAVANSLNMPFSRMTRQG